jgi:hypothetical protein
MLTQNEQEFLDYWQEKRNQNKFNPFFFGKGFSIGIGIGLLITLSFVIGWDKQVAVNALNLAVVLIAFLAIAIFCALFYNSFMYEQNEQRYQELLIKKNKQYK